MKIPLPCSPARFGFLLVLLVGMGTNGTDCIVELEKKRSTDFNRSMLHSAKSHGYETASMMDQLTNDGAEPSRNARTASVLVTRDRLRQVLKEQGIQLDGVAGKSSTLSPGSERSRLIVKK